MPHIILIGYRATGKTSVGKRLAEKLALPFYDSDQGIVSRIGKTIKEWVEEKGWDSFRQEEKGVLKTIFSQTPGVVSLGGGAVMDLENRAMVRKNGRVIWLRAEAQTILERMQSDPESHNNRPALSNRTWEKETRDLLIQRTPIYEQAADFIVDTEGKTIEEVANEICSIIQKGKDN
jgi:shikimate kinase